MHGARPKGFGTLNTHWRTGCSGKTSSTSSAALSAMRRAPQLGDRLQFGDVTVEVLYPIPTDDLNAASVNDHSVVLRIVYGSRAFLLTGDIEQTSESELVTDGGILSADLIKVPHHGSRTSPTQEFINAVGAKYAVISVGLSSPFGHPHSEIVERWQVSGAAVMTTGERRLISVSTDGKDLEITTFVP